MLRRRSQLFWYLLGGFLLLLAGAVALSGATFPYALPIVLVAAGGIVIVAALLHVLPTFPAFIVFLIGVIALGVAASAPYGFVAYTSTETHELTTAQASVEEAHVVCTVSTGTIKVSFTSNETLIYRVVFTKHFSFLYQPKVNFNYSVTDERLMVNASSSTANVDITLSQNLRSSLTLTTTTGTITVDVPTTASRVERMTLTTTTGEVWVNMTNTARLQSLVATATTGNVEAYIKSSSQSRDAAVQLRTTTGRVKVNMNITNIESDIRASTTTGRVNADNVSGFLVLDKTQTFLHARTSDYDQPQSRKLDISANTTTGNVDVSAHHS